MHRSFFLAALGSAACVPTMPSAFVESTEVLDSGRVDLTVAGGAGAVAACCDKASAAAGFGGGEVRARIGVGGRQEVGVTAFGGAGSNPADGVMGGKLAYKIAPVPWLAIVANAGAYDFLGSQVGGGISHTAVFGADLAAILAANLDARGTQLYGGARGSFVIPILSGATGSTEALTVPIGLTYQASEVARLYVEGGLIFSGAQFNDEADPTFSGSGTQLGGYGALGVRFALR